MKKIAIVGVIIALVVASVLLWKAFKHWEDAKLTRQIIGTWSRGDFRKTFSSDGHCSTSIGESNDLIKYQGTWRVIDQMLVDTVTNAFSSKGRDAGPVPRVERVKIISVNKHQLDYKTTSGERITLSH